MSSKFMVERLDLRNFRRFPTLAIDFERDLTVLVGSNAGGKTAILDALAIVLGAFVGGFDPGSGRSFSSTDAHLRRVGSAATQEAQYPVSARAALQVDASPIFAARELRGEANRTTWGDAAALRDVAKRLQADVRAGNDPVLPLVAYYGVQRGWQTEGKSRKPSRSRLDAYSGALAATPQSATVAAAMRWATLAALQRAERAQAQSPLVDAILGNVSEVIRAMLNVESDHVEQVVRCEAVRFDFEEELIVADLALARAEPVTLPVSSLSHGLRSVLGIATDLAYRAALLNPHLGPGAHLQTPGVVLVDEVDLHLHPRWQQQIIPQLQSAFPGIQLLVTTHSPQVLSTVEGRCVRQLDTASTVLSAEPLAFTRGHPSQDVLERVQDVPARAPQLAVTRQLEHYLKLVDAGEGESGEALALREELDSSLGGAERDAALLRADNAIRLARFRK